MILNNFYLLSLTTLTSEYSIIDVIVKIIPNIVEPVANNEIFVMILPVSVNYCTVHTIKNNPNAKNAIPGMP